MEVSRDYHYIWRFFHIHTTVLFIMELFLGSTLTVVPWRVQQYNEFDLLWLTFKDPENQATHG